MRQLLFRHSRGIAAGFALLLCALPVLPRVAISSPHFLSSFTAYEVGRGARSVATGDLDRDGRLDLVVTNRGSNSASLLLGNGDGTFRPKVDLATGATPLGLALGDLNEDGAPDLAVANAGEGTASIFPGNGDGTFGPRTDLGAGAGPVAVAITDLDGDGHLDLVVVNGGSGSATVRLGHGDGTFGVRADVGVGDSPWSGAIGDLDRDGHPDLLVSHRSSSTLSVLLGVGNGSFAAPTDYVTGYDPAAIAIADLDGDGVPDVATANNYGHSLSILRGTGSGALGPSTDYAMPGYREGVAIGDFNADGVADVVVTGSGGVASVLLGDGAGGFLPRLDFSTGADPIQIVVGDFDGNGRADLATADFAFGYASTVSVLIGNGDGTFGTTRRLGTGFFRPGEIAIGDMNGDGHPDLVAGSDSRVVMVHLGDGTGRFPIREDSETVREASFLRLADLNGDGKLDVVTTHSHGVSVVLGNGDGTLGAEQAFDVGADPRWLALGDVSGDGHPDVVVSCADGVSVLPGNGDGTLGAPSLYPTAIGFYFPTRVEIGDVNNDHVADLVVSHQDRSGTVLMGRGGGVFGAPHQFDAGVQASSFALGDLNADGNLDVAATYVGNQTVSVILGHGDSTFASPVPYGVGNAPSVGIAWLDGDAIPDLAVMNSESGTVSALLGRGDGSLKPRSDLGCGLSAQSMALGDLNGDGVSDMAFSLYPTGISLLISDDPAAAPILESFRAAETSDGVRLEWRFSDPGRWSDVHVERTERGASWATVAVEPVEEAGTTVAVDRSAPAGSATWYRLAAVDLDGQSTTTGPVRATPAEPITRIELSAVIPNPGPGPVSFEIALPRPDRVRVTILDLQGRIVATPANVVLGAGRHPISWNGVGDRAAAGPGLYFVRLQTSQASLVRRFALIR